MTTAEYAVGTLGAVAVGGCLLLIAPTMFGQLSDIIETALDPGRLLELIKDQPRYRLGR